jgi:hypothetical protein
VFEGRNITLIFSSTSEMRGGCPGEDFKGYVQSLTVSLQFMTKFTEKIRLKQALCNPGSLIGSTCIRPNALRITLECSRVF